MVWVVLKVDLNTVVIVNTMLQNGTSALFESASSGDADVVKMLVEYGVAVDLKDKVANCVIVTCGCNIGCGFIAFVDTIPPP